MKSILNLFKKSPAEEQLEAELSGSTRKPSATSTPPRRGPAASPTHPEAGAGELATLRASLSDIEARLQAAHQERDSIRAEFSQYREAVNSEQRSLEAENKRLRQSLDETGRMLSKQIASGGLDSPLPGVSANDTDGPRGLQKAIAANKAHQAQTTNQFQRIPRPTL